VGHAFGRFGVSENVVVVAHFPKSFVVVPLEVERGARFEDSHEAQKIGGRVCALCQEVKMIGHEAVRVNEKRKTVSAVEKAFADHFGGFGIGEEGLAHVAADGDEVGFGADVVFGGEAWLFAVERHMQSGIITYR
jgi:hypothetical protein